MHNFKNLKNAHPVGSAVSPGDPLAVRQGPGGLAPGPPVRGAADVVHQVPVVVLPQVQVVAVHPTDRASPVARHLAGRKIINKSNAVSSLTKNI